MKQFYVRLISGSNKVEFPQNKANHFRNRLPQPLRFTKPGWQVGLASIHVPKAPPRLKLLDSFMFRFSWYVEPDPEDAPDLVVEKEVLIRVQDLDRFRDIIKTGTDMMSAVRHLYYKVLEDQTRSDLRLYTVTGDGKEELNYMTMEKNKSGGFIIDNTDVYTGDSHRYPKLTIGRQLALDMGWIQRKVLTNGRLGYVLGPNLRKDFPTDEIPSADDLVMTDNNGDEVFYVADRDGLHLSCYCNWIFSLVDAAFEKSFGSNQRPLFVYSDAVQSSMMGMQWTNLLRDLSYSTSVNGYQMQQIQYLPVRNQVMDILEIRVEEESGALVDFEEQGNTIVTLHFKYGDW